MVFTTRQFFKQFQEQQMVSRVGLFQILKRIGCPRIHFYQRRDRIRMYSFTNTVWNILFLCSSDTLRRCVLVYNKRHLYVQACKIEQRLRSVKSLSINFCFAVVRLSKEYRKHKFIKARKMRWYDACVLLQQAMSCRMYSLHPS